MMLYVDTSAFIKPFTGEPEAGPMAEALEEHADDLVSSLLLDVEASRIAGRVGGDAPALIVEALAGVRRVQIGLEIVRAAAQVLPGSGLGTVDAIHLATALALPEPPLVATYDRRLQDACRAVGLRVLAPA
ncbi:MAG: type II toxin-antitoxin system VapC family toxin [Gaiellales bacterium]